MSVNQVFAVIRKYAGAVGISIIVGCSSSDQSAPLTHGLGEGPQREASGPEAKRNMEDFIAMASAFIRRVGQDVSGRGYAVVFTDIGPESLERDAPDVFRDLAKRSSGGGVQVRGFSRAEEKDGLFRDKQTGEKGVGLWMVDFEEDGQGGHIVTGSWSDGPGEENWHDVKYLVVREGTGWRAQPYRPAPKTTAGSKPLLPGVSLFDGPEALSGQLVFQRLDYKEPIQQWKCISNVVYSVDLETKTLAKLADLGTLDAQLVKVSDDGRMLCLYKTDGGMNPRLFVHSVEKGQTKEVRFPHDIQTLGIAVLGDTVFVASYSYGPLYQYDFPSESLSEFRPAGLPGIPEITYPRTRFGEPGVLFFQDGPLAHYRWTQSSGELKKLPDFSYCMTADGKHVWLGPRSGSFYPLIISSASRMSYGDDIGLARKATEPSVIRIITNFKFPGGRSCGLDQLSPCGGYALLSVEAGGMGIFPGSISHYIVDLTDGHNRMLLRNEYATLRHDLGNVSRAFWVKKVN